jgi:hypothetical protein
LITDRRAVLACFHGVLVVLLLGEKIFAWSPAAASFQLFGGGDDAAPGTWGS